MAEPGGSSPAIPWVLALVVVTGLVTFAAARDEDAPPVTTTTTTTFPREGYVDEITAALLQETHVALGDEGARCIAGAMVDTIGPDGLEALADEPAPLASLTPMQRDEVLRLVVTCVDPVVAQALLGSGASTTEPAVPLPDEGQ
ncbi:MAG TPA: hypothetical protein VJ804_05275 [Acidimicrobiales bacterium]|nr:hypothetical protein [Acidimicrobiales bacterium]